MLIFLLVLFTIITCILGMALLRSMYLDKLDHRALHNLLTEEEKKYYINEYKKILTAKIIYEAMPEDKFAVEIAHEVVRERRSRE